ncbi:RNA polymerase sigma factor [Conexibacter sp. SYSU D00693]|uniref:RNA polymerase sigma factor n=1 Tax=Conexibacter sp. SYSU D00693 TaxID=2812560 RepID=UPI00196B43AA|nr:sigma-70 family RNA polymerase sigma factor [Conexibacter sp. SYSU D00693]
MTAGAQAALDRAFREEWASVVAALARRLRDLDLAEDAASDAFAEAARTWPRDGVPASPGAWLTTVARRRALDRLRRDRRHAERVAALADLREPPPPGAGHDDRLELLFACCHPSLAPEARIALTLRAVAGLTTAEIARAFLVDEHAMAQRLLRAKAKVARAGIPFRVPPPEELPDRLGQVLHVVYLVFNEGWAASRGDALVRRELCTEAVQLARLVHGLLPQDAEATGLLALLLLLDARRATRTGEGGAFVAPDAQDATAWDRPRIDEGLALTAAAFASAPRDHGPGPYALQAAIAAEHAQPPPDWTRIATLYAALARRQPSPVVELNQAVALTFADRLDEGRTLLDRLKEDGRLDRYQPLHAADAELHRRSGDHERARAAYDRAIALSANAVERAELVRRREALSAPDRC